MRKIIIYISFFVILMLTASIIIIFRKYDVFEQEVDKYIDTSQYLYSDWDDRHELIKKVCEKNGNWKNYFLSSKFRKKYNEKDGFFGKIQFDKIEVQPYSEEDYPFAMYPHIIMTQGKKKTAYIFQYKFSDNKEDRGLEDIIISYDLQLTDDDGNKLDAKVIFTNNMKSENLFDLARGNEFEESVAVSDKFHKKYPFFLDLFIHYSPLSFNRITFLEKESDLDNNIAIFEVDSVLECKKRKYKVKLILDKRLYLDDVEVELIGEEGYEGDWTYITAKLLYKNSNWDSLELTDNFRKKYTPAKGIIKEIDEMNIDYGLGTETVIANKEYIKTFMHKDMYEVKYKLEYVRDENNFTEDIIVTKLN